MTTRELFEEQLRKVPKHIKDQVEKMMTCAHLYDGDMCELGTQCDPARCNNWKHYEKGIQSEGMGT